MDTLSLTEGVQYSVTFFADDQLLCGAVVEKLDSHSINVSLFRDDESSVEVALDVLEALWTPFKSQAVLAHLDGLSREMAAEEDRYREREQRTVPPTDEIGDIPF